MARDARGRFLPGPDADRHPLSRLDRSNGFAAALRARMPSRVRAWLRWKIKHSCRNRQPVRPVEDIPF